MKKKSDKTIEKATKIIKKIPSTETGVQTLCCDGKYLITHYPEKEKFTLWKIHQEGYEKISVSESPLDFDDIIPWKYKNN